MADRRRFTRLALVLPVAAVVLTAVPAAAAPAPLHWGACPADSTAPGLECSTLPVPLDYADPGGRKIELTISRLAGTTPARRRGVLVVHPGGPSPGLTYPALMAQLGLPPSVRESYDVIGFNQRGLEHSTPVTCDLTPEQEIPGNIPPYAHNSADVAKRAEQVRTIARQCAASDTAWLLPHLSTADVARDVDSIRAALGEDKISYDGASYGTYLGAVYTTLFPEHSDRFVLDSNLGPHGWDFTADRLYGRGFQDRFPDFAKHLGLTTEQAAAEYTRIAGELDRSPVQAPDGRYDGALFRVLTFGLLYNDALLPALAADWKALDAHRPPPPLPGTPETPPDPGTEIAARYATICTDSAWPKSVATYQAAVTVDRLRHPLFGAAAAGVQPCAFWPVPARPPVRIGSHGPSNILMVQNVRDPATPLAGALRMRHALGERARMVTVDDGGHGVYLVGPKNRCASDAVTRFLTTGERPAADTFCAAEPQ